MILRLLMAALAALILWGPERVRADMPIYSVRDGLAIGGYDVVAFFEEQRAVVGSSSHALMWKGVVWHFVSARNQARFEADPRSYAPVFGGYCAYAMSQGLLHDGNPKLWAIVDGELFLLNNRRVQLLWQADTVQLIADGRRHWPAVLRK